jgi:hypothetical protein
MRQKLPFQDEDTAGAVGKTGCSTTQPLKNTVLGRKAIKNREKTSGPWFLG